MFHSMGGGQRAVTIEASPDVTAAGGLGPPRARRTRRRRRPSGAAPPLPRNLGFTGRSWLIASAALLAWMGFTFVSEPGRRLTDRIDAAVLRQIARLRADRLTDVADAIDRVGSGWAMTAVSFGLIIAMIAFRRWRHLFTFLASVVLVEIVGTLLYLGFARPRPYGVTILGRWAGYSFPAAPIAVITFVTVGIIYSLVPAGRPRRIAKFGGGAVVVPFAAAQMYLATFHPSDILVAVAFSTAIPLNAFRLFTPNEIFPVAYRQGKTAHLDVGGRRGVALREAIQDQLGLTVVDIKPFGLAGSGGSTPLLITVAGDPDTKLFGKLYAMSHVRADRLYKLGRTVLYGRLEDEAPFQSVRRLVQYEDYALRLLQDIGIKTAAPYGIVEITPEREYLLITEFFDGAQEIGDAPIDDGVIDEGLMLIRRLWDLGLAHRDIKPANLLVRDGHVLLIDVAFVQVRPSPWRQAVDLANMMLVLAVRTDPQRVFERARQYFSAEEIAEAFAATRGIASPTQLRGAMKQDGRDLLAEFRALAPERRPISLQRWSVKRVALALVLLLGAAFVTQATVNLFTPSHDLAVSGTPTCGTGNLMILMAQAVPSATAVPCISSLPAGWSLGGVKISHHRARFWLHSDVAGKRAVTATLLPADRCGVQGAMAVPSDEVGMRRYERPANLPPALQTTRTYIYTGACVTYRFSFDREARPGLMFDADSALAFQPRAALVEEVRNRTGLRLCGAAARACAGER